MKRILVGLDGSSRSASVLSAAIATARAHGGHLVLVRAIGLPPEVPQDFWKSTEKPLIEVLRQDAAAYLDTCSSRVPLDLRASPPSEVVVGAPWQVVCDAARRTGADLVVIGSHGYAGLDRLLGTTAAKVVNHAPCSVLVVREPGTSAST